jgi:RNA polymerase sigma factor (sigma-70 family)
MPSDPYQTQTALLRRLRDPADAQGWAQFCDLYRPLMLRYARGRGLGEHDAEDLVQDLLVIRLRQSLSEFVFDRTRGRFRSWLWRVTANAVRDQLRKIATEKRGRDDLGQQEAGTAPAVDEALEREWEQAHRKRVLEYALQTIKARSDPTTWACFEQRILKDVPAADVGRTLNLNVNAVYTNAHRVTARVREICWQYDEDFAEDPTPPEPRG